MTLKQSRPCANESISSGAKSRPLVTVATLEVRKVVVVSDTRDCAAKTRVLLIAATLGPQVAMMTHDRNFVAKLPVSLTTIRKRADLGVCRPCASLAELSLVTLHHVCFARMRDARALVVCAAD